jgi:hypothetical protein
MLMKKFMFFSLVMLGMECFVYRGWSQGTLAPLYLVISGSGSVTPLQNGQLLEVGQTYEMTATPDLGFAFGSWVSFPVFTITQTNFDSFGDPIIPPTVSTVTGTGTDYQFQPVLDFTMLVEQITPDGANPNITQSIGWQANFVPIPEPSDAGLVACAVTAVAVLRRQWPCCPTRRRLTPTASKVED